MEDIELNIDDVSAELATRHFKEFVAYTKEDYIFNWHHELICEALNDFAEGKIKKLFIFVPPQHGKSELSTRRLPAYILGRRPKTRIAIVSYAATLAQAFNRDIQRIIDTPEYNKAFPGTTLSSSNVVTDAKSGFLRNSTMFEIVDHRGAVRTIGVDGGLTGFPVDIAIFDDLYKNREEALSEKNQQTIKSFWDSVLIPRLHNNSQLLGVFTRWAEVDIAGYVLGKEKDWKVISIPAIKENNHDKNDPRKIGEALWEHHLTLDKLMAIKASDEVVFNAMYQQNPKASKEILVYPNYTIIDEMPVEDYEDGFGLDFGWSNDPTAKVYIKMKNGAVYMEERTYQTGLTSEDIANTYSFELGENRKLTVAESADGGKECKEQRKLRINCVEAIKGPGSVLKGINEIRKMRLYVTRHSPNLIRELNNYQWEMVGDKKTNRPIDKDNHLLDAMRYYIMYRKLKPGLKI